MIVAYDHSLVLMRENSSKSYPKDVDNPKVAPQSMSRRSQTSRSGRVSGGGGVWEEGALKLLLLPLLVLKFGAETELSNVAPD